MKERERDGRASAEYFNLINELSTMGIEVIFVDDYARSQQEKENNLAGRIGELMKKKGKIIAVMGDFHACKNPAVLSGKKIFPAAYMLAKSH